MYIVFSCQSVPVESISDGICDLSNEIEDVTIGLHSLDFGDQVITKKSNMCEG